MAHRYQGHLLFWHCQERTSPMCTGRKHTARTPMAPIQARGRSAAGTLNATGQTSWNDAFSCFQSAEDRLHTDEHPTSAIDVWQGPCIWQTGKNRYAQLHGYSLPHLFASCIGSPYMYPCICRHVACCCTCALLFLTCRCGWSCTHRRPDPYSFGIHKFSDAKDGEFTSIATVLDPSKWQPGIRRYHTIQEHST